MHSLLRPAGQPGQMLQVLQPNWPTSPAGLLPTANGARRGENRPTFRLQLSMVPAAGRRRASNSSNSPNLGASNQQL